MTIVVGAVVLAVLTVLVFLTLVRPRPVAPPTVPSPLPRALTCPLCGTALAAGEKVHSVVFATATPDKLMEIAGCPHCRPPATLRRVCPVCKKDLRPQDVVTARVFERKHEVGPRKTHVHVLGCPRCRS